MAETTSPVIRLKDVRLSFPNIFKAKEFKKGDGNFRYNATYILDPKIKAHKAMIKDIEAEADELISSNLKGKDIDDLDSVCFGLAKDNKKLKKRPEYEGMYYIKVAAREDNPPAVIDRKKNRLKDDSDSDQKPFSGCYVNATVTLWLQINDYGTKINANILIVQYNRTGEKFSGSEIDLGELEVVDIDDEESSDDDDLDFDDLD